MKSLVVEDDFTGRLILQKTLEKLGDCHIAVNGEEALSAFKISLEENARYDLICLDILMPVMNGHEVLRRIRKIEEQNDISPRNGVKVIVITSLRDNDNVATAFDAQCDYYITKPLHVEKLLALIASMHLTN